MKLTYYVLAVMMCFNVATVILANIGIEGVPLAAMSPDQIAEAYNATEIVESWNPATQEFYDVGAGLQFLWSKNAPLIESFVGTCEAFGAPDELVQPLRAIWRFFWVGFVISFFSGRDFMP